MQETDDIELLQRYANQNSEAAFAALVRRHLNLVYSVALRHVRNPHQAEEITQAVFVILARKAGHLRQDVVLSGWLYNTARLTAANFLRSESRRARREHEVYMQSILNESEPDFWPQLAPMLDGAMAGLAEKDRDAVVLRFFEGRKMTEVGAALGTNEEAAKKRVNRAVEKLRKFFTKHGVVLPSAVLTAAISANSVQAAPSVLVKSVTAVAMMKGVAASNSTLTLIKTTLKIMAWTNTKTAIVVGAAVMLAAGSTTIMIHHQRHNQPLPKSQPVASGQTDFSKASWTFAGYTNPESALESCMWAVDNGDVKSFLAGLSPGLVAALAGNSDSQIIRDKDRADSKKTLGYRILDKQVLSDHEVVLSVFIEGLDQTKSFSIQRFGNEWKISGKSKR